MRVPQNTHPDDLPAPRLSDNPSPGKTVFSFLMMIGGAITFVVIISDESTTFKRVAWNVLIPFMGYLKSRERSRGRLLSRALNERIVMNMAEGGPRM